MQSLCDMIANIISVDNIKPGDYQNEAGYLMCGQCHTPKQIDSMFGDDRKLSIMCECAKEQREREVQEKERRRFQMQVEELKRRGLSASKYRKWTFELDDRRCSDISDACRKYVAEWGQMKADNVGLLFFGRVGTGKSFYACCIANALLEKCVTALVTNFSRILNEMQSTAYNGNNNDLLDRLARYDLLVIDDLGAERNTGYAIEQVYSVIDSRILSGKPLIVTTNLSPSDIKNPENVAYERIYDRIIENSIPVRMVGNSRRPEIAAEKRQKYESLLGLGK